MGVNLHQVDCTSSPTVCDMTAPRRQVAAVRHRDPASMRVLHVQAWLDCRRWLVALGRLRASGKYLRYPSTRDACAHGAGVLQENVEILRRVIEAFNAGWERGRPDCVRLGSPHCPDAEWIPARGWLLLHAAAEEIDTRGERGDRPLVGRGPYDFP
jgi:hypothetical protein